MLSKLRMSVNYAPHCETVASRLGDETVILHLSRGIYFGLDAMGTIVWERLQEGDTPEAILAYIRANLSNVPGTVEAEVTHFLMQLLENELIAPR